MADSDSLMAITNDDDDDDEEEEDQSRLYIDETVTDCCSLSRQHPTKSVNTGNPFELDWIFLAYANRYQTRSSQTILTSNTNLLLKRHRSTSCQAEYFATTAQGTSTDENLNEQEERMAVVKKQRTEKIDLLPSLST